MISCGGGFTSGIIVCEVGVITGECCDRSWRRHIGHILLDFIHRFRQTECIFWLQHSSVVTCMVSLISNTSIQIGHSMSFSYIISIHNLFLLK